MTPHRIARYFWACAGIPESAKTACIQGSLDGCRLAQHVSVGLDQTPVEPRNLVVLTVALLLARWVRARRMVQAAAQLFDLGDPAEQGEAVTASVEPTEHIADDRPARLLRVLDLHQHPVAIELVD